MFVLLLTTCLKFVSTFTWKIYIDTIHDFFPKPLLSFIIINKILLFFLDSGPIESGQSAPARRERRPHPSDIKTV